MLRSVLRHRLAAVTATLAVAAAACGGGAEVGSESSAPQTTAEAAPDTEDAPSDPASDPAPTTSEDAPAPKGSSGGDAANREALDFSASAVSGGTVEGVDYAGGDVVLWIWAPW